MDITERIAILIDAEYSDTNDYPRAERVAREITGKFRVRRTGWVTGPKGVINE